jgi:hypothetical protein
MSCAVSKLSDLGIRTICCAVAPSLAQRRHAGYMYGRLRPTLRVC